MAADPSVFLMGEDVDADGGVFKTNIGLPDKFPGRVLSTPICENGFMGVALGMSITGMRPVVEIMFADFLPTAGDAIVNQLPKYRYMSGGQFTVPVTVRISCGGGARFGTQHSATAESWYMAQPGMRIVTASSPGRAHTSCCGRPSATTTRSCSTSTRCCTPARAPSSGARSRMIGTAARRPRGHRRDHRRHAAHGRAVAGRRRGARRRGHQRRGHRPALDPAHRPRDHRGLGRARPVAWSSPRSSGTRAAGAPPSSASWPRRASRGRRRRPRSACPTTC